MPPSAIPDGTGILNWGCGCCRYLAYGLEARPTHELKGCFGKGRHTRSSQAGTGHAEVVCAPERRGGNTCQSLDVSLLIHCSGNRGITGVCGVMPAGSSP